MGALPALEFDDTCCRTHDVAAHLLGASTAKMSRFLVLVTTSSGPVCATAVATAKLALQLRRAVRSQVEVAVTTADDTVSANLGSAMSSHQLLGSQTAMVLLGCPSAENESNQQCALIGAGLKFWLQHLLHLETVDGIENRSGQGSSINKDFGRWLGGCGFAVRNPCIVQTVSEFALQQGLAVLLGADSTWWIRVKVGGSSQLAMSAGSA